MTTTCPKCGAEFYFNKGDGASFRCGTWSETGSDYVSESTPCLTRQRDALLARVEALEKFANRFLSPEDLGYSVTNWVRDDAREALGLNRVETTKGHQ